MSFLALDIGNSSLTAGWFESGQVLKTAYRSFSAVDSPDIYIDWLLAETPSSDYVTHIGIASVVPASIAPIRELLMIKLPNCKVDVIGDSVKPAFKIDYHPVESLGIDRICNAAGALSMIKPPFIVVDFGTAITLDVMDAAGVFRGGAILPGPATAIRSLTERTAQLPLVELSFPETALANNTRDAIRSGVLWGVVNAVDGLLKKVMEEMGESCHVVATGGFAPMLAPHSQLITEVIPTLTLTGVYRIAAGAS